MSVEQLVSVADAIIRDPTTKAGLMLGTANINSAIKIAMASADARGGIGNKLLYTYFHTKEMTVDIEQASFGSSILALNSGVSVVTGAATVVQTDCLVTSSSGSATITLTPIGDVTAFLSDGSIQTVTPSTKDITLSGAASQSVTVIYETSKSVDQITIESGAPPKIVDLTLVAEIRDQATDGIKKYLHINIPSFQISGTYDLGLTANGISSEKLSGKSLSVSSTDCGEDYYAKVSYIPVSVTITYADIAALPSTIAWTKSVAHSAQISVLGIRGGLYANTNITSDCTFALSGSFGAGMTVGAAGLISTSASGVTTTGTAIIAATYATGSLVDYTQINFT